MTATVMERQTVFDLALHYFGSTEACFLIAERLGICVTDVPPAGAQFDYTAGEVIDRMAVGYYKQNGIVPTTEN